MGSGTDGTSIYDILNKYTIATNSVAVTTSLGTAAHGKAATANAGAGI